MTYANGTKHSFYAARTELTWREYLLSAQDGTCKAPYADYPKRLHDVTDAKLADNHPVTGVPIAAINCYVGWLKQKTGKIYRLPTSDEWEFLARAGAQTQYPWGTELGNNNAIVEKHFDRIRFRAPNWSVNDPRMSVWSGLVYPVAQLPPNAWGLYDVVGNISEATTERVPATEGCLKRAPRLGLSPADCELVVARGGDTWVLKSDANPFEYRVKWLAASPTFGYRLVRD
ncbi:hypothetical protein ACFB49_09930 [Sphingomonas sp. DBB INV C78]|uniref:formylglycine-generating enzyme family protein n=1 Tax=Sphingomonas sp. DBB INV C78 TaxID=3349434 RepID=UPI0036D2A201